MLSKNLDGGVDVHDCQGRIKTIVVSFCNGHE